MVESKEKLSWTVDPTDPILPPTGELTKVTGVIGKIYAEKHEQYFEPQAYKTVEIEIKKNILMSRIVGVLVFFNGQYGMLANAGKNNQLTETIGYFVNVQIDGVVYHGWIGACPFQPGDEVELAVAWENDHYELYAITRPKDKIISICPNCVKGKRKYIKGLVQAFIVFFIFISLFFLTIVSLTGEMDISDFYFIIAFSSLLTIGVSSLKLIFEFNTLFNTNIRLAENIFKVLGFKNTSNINLESITSKRLKKIYKEAGIKSKKNTMKNYQ